MVLRYKVAESIAFTVETIARSPLVKEYMIGYTSRQGLKRRSEYIRQHGYEHLVILADRLTQSDALELERALHDYLKEPEVRTTSSWKKYEKSRREGIHYESAGPRLQRADAPSHSVYMAWLEP